MRTPAPLSRSDELNKSKDGGQEELLMAEILVVGITHYPPLAGSDDKMAWILKLMLQNPRLPERLRRPDGWPKAMQNEWGNDEGVNAAWRHRERLLQCM